MKRYFAILLLAGCIKREEVKTDAQSTTTMEAATQTETTSKGTVSSRTVDVLQTGPITVETTTTVETFAPDGGLARKVVRSVHRLAAPSSEVKEQSSAEDETYTTRDRGGWTTVTSSDYKTDAQQSSKPAMGFGLGFKLGLLLIALLIVVVVVVRKDLAANFPLLSWLAKRK